MSLIKVKSTTDIKSVIFDIKNTLFFKKQSQMFSILTELNFIYNDNCPMSVKRFDGYLNEIFVNLFFIENDKSYYLAYKYFGKYDSKNVIVHSYNNHPGILEYDESGNLYRIKHFQDGKNYSPDNKYPSVIEFDKNQEISSYQFEISGYKRIKNLMIFIQKERLLSDFTCFEVCNKAIYLNTLVSIVNRISKFSVDQIIDIENNLTQQEIGIIEMFCI